MDTPPRVLVTFLNETKCCCCVSGLYGGGRDVSGRRDQRDEPDEGAEAAAHAAVSGVKEPTGVQPVTQSSTIAAGSAHPSCSQAILFVHMGVVLLKYIHKHFTISLNLTYTMKDVAVLFCNLIVIF